MIRTALISIAFAFCASCLFCVVHVCGADADCDTGTICEGAVCVGAECVVGDEASAELCQRRSASLGPGDCARSETCEEGRCVSADACVAEAEGPCGDGLVAITFTEFSTGEEFQGCGDAAAFCDEAGRCR